MKGRLLIIVLVLFAGTRVMAQTKIRGTVLDENNQPLMGVFVSPVGKMYTVTTDFDGLFEIEVPEGSGLTFTYMGIRSKTEAAHDSMVVIMDGKKGSYRRRPSYVPIERGFHCLLDVCGNFNISHCGAGLDLILGARLSPYYHIGGGIGFHSLLKTNIQDYNMFATLYFNNILYIPTNGNVFPLFDVGIGCNYGWLGVNQSYGTSTYGLYVKGGVGFEVERFNMSVGYELLGTHTGYVKIGFNL